MLLNILPHSLLQNLFFYFPSLKPRCVLWSENHGNQLYFPRSLISPVWQCNPQRSTTGASPGPLHMEKRVSVSWQTQWEGRLRACWWPAVGHAALLCETSPPGTERKQQRERNVWVLRRHLSPALSSFGDQRHCFPSHMQVNPFTVPLTEPVGFSICHLQPRMFCVTLGVSFNRAWCTVCLLYTSDAADETSTV